MFRHRNDPLFFFLLSFLVTFAACRPAPDPPEPSTQPVSQDEVTAIEETKPLEQKTVELAPPKETKATEIPSVKLSETAKATCKVNVGDMFPGEKIATSLAEAAPISEDHRWVGSKGGVVVFFEVGTKPVSVMKTQELLEDLQKYHLQYGESVRITGIPTGGTAALPVEVGFTVLADPEGTAFADVAVDSQPPRLFVLDATGKILWMDLEYSNTTREQLKSTVELISK